MPWARQLWVPLAYFGVLSMSGPRRREPGARHFSCGYAIGRRRVVSRDLRRELKAVTATALREIIPDWTLGETANSRLDEELLARAYRFSEEAHRGQTRNSGEPYVTHCVEVAKILADLQLDTTTVASGLIHDVVEDTKFTVADVEREFGKEIAGDRRRADEDREAAEQRVEPGPAGRELPQAAALDREGRARHHRQARGPAAQHADARLPARGEAAPHRAGDARPLRAARASLRHGEDAVGARGPRLQAPRDRGLQGAGEARSRRSAPSARSSSPRCASRSSASWRARGSRTSRSPAGRSTSGRSTRR